MQELIDFYASLSEYPSLTMGCERVVDGKKFVDLNLIRLKHTKKKEYDACVNRLKRYKDAITRKNNN